MTQSRATLAADFAPVQAHYDLSDEFFTLFLDPSMMYSCAKFDAPETTLAEAQRAKIDLSLGKLDLRQRGYHSDWYAGTEYKPQ